MALSPFDKAKLVVLADKCQRVADELRPFYEEYDALGVEETEKLLKLQGLLKEASGEFDEFCLSLGG